MDQVSRSKHCSSVDFSDQTESKKNKLVSPGILFARLCLPKFAVETLAGQLMLSRPSANETATR